MQFIKRIFYFILTNIAVMIAITIVLNILSFFFPGLLGGSNIMGLAIQAGVIGFAGAFISLWMSRWSAKSMYGIQLIDGADRHDTKLQLVYDTVARISGSAGIRMPEVGYYESAEPNAFATGATKNSALVAVSTGLLDVMTPDEIEGVVGHEMAHILNGDMVTLTLVQGVMNTFVYFFATLAARAIESYFRSDDEEGQGWIYFVVQMALQVVFGFLASFVVMYVSRAREYRADIGGAQYTSRAKMIAGLRRLQKITEEMQGGHHDSKMAALMITEPDSMFSTHPSLTNRIQALENNYQLH